MIVRDEECNLRACLEPVAPLFDEIVIVDTGSRDATRHIAADFTPHVFDFPWRDDFSAARNESLRHATGDWVFWLDADDRVSPENIARLRTLFARLTDQPSVYTLDTVLHSQYASEGVRLTTHFRLFRRHELAQWQGRVHEQIRPSLEHLGYRALRSDAQIDHLGYRDPAVVQKKAHRNLRLLHMDYALDPDNESTLYHLGLTALELGDPAGAQKHLHRLLGNQSVNLTLAQWARRALAEAAQRRGDLQSALRHLNEALAASPNDEVLLYTKATILFELGDFASAGHALGQIARGTASPEHFNVPGQIRDLLAPRKLAEVDRLQGQYARAEETLRTVLQKFPFDAHAWYALGCLYGDTRQEARFREVIHRLQACPDGVVFAGALQAAWRLERGDHQAAGKQIDDLIVAAPEVPLPRMLRCRWLDRIQAPRHERVRAYRDLLRVQPGCPLALSMLRELDVPRRAPAAAANAASPALAWQTSVVIAGSFDAPLV